MRLMAGNPRYPTRNGIALPTQEIWLPTSWVETHNNHHREWTAKRFGSSILYIVFRDMISHQEILPTDQHDWIHFHYEMPKFPTPIQAMEEIERGYWENEQLKVRDGGHYKERAIGKSIFDLCKKEYERLK